MEQPPEDNLHTGDGAPPPAPLPTRRVARTMPGEVQASPPVGEIVTGDASTIALRALPETEPEPSLGTQPPEGQQRGPRWNILAVSVVSFFTSAASEMVVPVRMLFLVTVLQASLPLAGFIEGLAESGSAFARLLSGRLERPGRRKPLLLLGYGLSGVARPLLGLAGIWQAALGLILLDRAGRGLRSAPRDAALASAPAEGGRGNAFAFHRGLDNMGALLGPLLAFVVLLVTYDDLRNVFLWAAVPGALSVLALALMFREPRLSPAAEATPVQAPAAMPPACALGRRFWLFTAISVVFAFGGSAEAFIFLRTADLADSVLIVPLVYFGFSLVYSLLASPMSALSARFGRLPVLAGGYAVFALCYLGWAVSVEAWNAWVLFLVFGVYAAATAGLGRAFAADIVAPEHRRGALAWYGGIVGFAALPANVIAGLLWSSVGPSATFTFGFWAAIVAVALTLAWLPRLRSRTAPEEAFPSDEATRLFVLDMESLASPHRAHDAQV